MCHVVQPLSHACACVCSVSVSRCHVLSSAVPPCGLSVVWTVAAVLVLVCRPPSCLLTWILTFSMTNRRENAYIYRVRVRVRVRGEEE